MTLVVCGKSFIQRISEAAEYLLAACKMVCLRHKGCLFVEPERERLDLEGLIQSNLYITALY